MDPATIRFYNQPEAELIPPHELTPGKTALEGFVWRIGERPTLPDVVAYYRSEDYGQPEQIDAIESEIEAAKELINDQDIKIPNQLQGLDRNKFRELKPKPLKSSILE